MKKKRLLLWALLVVVLVSEGCATVRGIGKDIQSLGRALKGPVSGGYANASVVTYPAPLGGIPLSSDFSVTADGRQVDVYQVKVPPQWIGYTPCPLSYEIASMAYFDFSGTVNVQITSTRPVSSAVVRPLRHGIEPSVNGNTISFTLSRPLNLSVEINGDDRHNLHLFANRMETNAPSPSDPNVIYYGPGVHGDGSRIRIGDGQTVYIAGGAVVYGTFSASSANSVTVRGRGIMSGEKSGWPCVRLGGHASISLSGVNNINLEGFIAVDSAEDWLFQLVDSDSVTMDNVKAITWRGNGDGLGLVSVNSALVKNVFIRSTDDTFTIKAAAWYFGLVPPNQPTENITIQDSVGWTDGAGHPFSFYEQNATYIRNVNFRNIDIIHAYAGPVVWFSCCDSTGEQYNVMFDDIRIEDNRTSSLFDLSTTNVGSVHGVYFNNFQVLGGNNAPSTISGNDPSHMVSDITFNNLNILGNMITSAGAGQFSIGGNTSNINFTTGGSVPPPNPTPPPANPPCNNFWNSSLAVPASFGASFNWFTSGKELLMQAFCGSGGAYFAVGNGSIMQFIYKTGYTLQNGAWTPFNYSGTTMDAGRNWFVGTASTAFASLDLSPKQSVLAYICDWNGTRWNCGCNDGSCGTSYWNLQQFKQ